MSVLYTGEATSVGGRGGKVKSSDGLLDFELRLPKEMGGPGGAFTNPEQLFAVVYASCFNGAMMAVAENKKAILDATVTAKASISKTDADGFFISVAFDINIPGISQEEAEEVVKQAHQVCPYSKATRNNVEVTFNVTNK